MRHPRSTPPSDRGAATVEHAALAGLIALALLAAGAALAGAPAEPASRRLGAMVARRIACAPRLPRPCRRDPLVRAYGRRLAYLVRALAPPPGDLVTGGGLMPVDFRYCRRPSCAFPAPGARLSAAGRRATAFVEVQDRRRSDGTVTVTYWLYRPGERWRPLSTAASATAVASAPPAWESTTALKLVPLETLPGRNHYRFRASEHPPWQWRV